MNHQSAPPVWNWYIAYCVAMAIVYILVALAGFGMMLVGWGAFDIDMPRDTARELKFQGVVMAACLPLFIPFAIAPFLRGRRWHHVYGIVLIAVGLTSCCCWPASIPLLIYWIKPETKHWMINQESLKASNRA